MSRTPRHLRYLALSSALVLLVAALVWLARERQSMARTVAPAPVRVPTAVARQASVPVQLEALGTVTPLHTVAITSQVSGQVLAVHYEEGQLVHEGDALIDIDARPLRATLLQAQGTLEKDRALLAQAKMDLARFRAAWARNAIAKQQLDDQEKQVQQAAGVVKNDLGVVQFDQAQLAYCHISAPLSGRIGLRLVDPGNVLSAQSGTPLAVITQLTPISVVFTVAEDDLPSVLEQTRAGLRLSVEALDRTRTKTLARGTLSALDNQIDSSTGTLKARAVFDNQDEALFPNQFVNVRLRVRTIEGTTTLPTSALQHDGSDSFVYVIRDTHAHVQRVQPGIIAGDTAQVDGIAPGTVVANGSFDKLRDGIVVAVADAAPATRPVGAETGAP
ncbi:MAG: efflux RND transporter periplasmic adaptor subunit [Polyangiaceae bacterium]